jgi:hypothetical protein
LLGQWFEKDNRVYVNKSNTKPNSAHVWMTRQGLSIFTFDSLARFVMGKRSPFAMAVFMFQSR